jgi:hypothetical protein
MIEEQSSISDFAISTIEIRSTDIDDTATRREIYKKRALRALGLKNTNGELYFVSQDGVIYTTSDLVDRIN